MPKGPIFGAQQLNHVLSFFVLEYLTVPLCIIV